MATQVATGWVAKGEINFPLVFHLDEADKDRDDGGGALLTYVMKSVDTLSFTARK